jgi:hypothetical protein
MAWVFGVLHGLRHFQWGVQMSQGWRRFRVFPNFMSVKF